MKKIYLGLALCTAIFSQSFAGNGGLAPVGGGNYYTIPAKAKYIPGVIIVKVKPQFKAACGNNGIALPALQKAIDDMAGQVSVKFPNHSLTEARYDKHGEAFIDLGLVYKIAVSPKDNLEGAINRLLATGMLEYAEPSFIMNPVYTVNDPLATTTGQYHITRIKANQAWDVTKGDSTVTIGVVDSGNDLQHPDLLRNAKRNLNDPIDGVDNDNDGYVDNYLGWDFVGASNTAPFPFPGDNNTQVNTANNNHGVHTSGLVAAVTDNATGVAGVGFNIKYLQLKCSDDAGNGLYLTDEAMVYAADHGCAAVSCSFGTSFYSAYGQDIVTYITVNKNSLVIAAAGNDASDSPDNYPAYFKHVLSVASTMSTDRVSSFTNYNYMVDISAPGSDIRSTVYRRANVLHDYDVFSGTSMATPIVAGVAGLIKSVHPNYTGKQIGVLLKSTADNIYITGGQTTLNNTAKYKDKLGTGRVNAAAAVTYGGPGLAMDTNFVTDGADNVYITGDTVTFTGVYRNYLDASSAALGIKLSSPAANTTPPNIPTISIISDTATLGVLANNQSITQPVAFKFRILQAAGIDLSIPLKITYRDGAGYTSFEYVTLYVNQTYAKLVHNNITTTATSNGRVGWVTINNTTGVGTGNGFQYKGTNTLYEMGLMVGTSGDTVSNSVRGSSTASPADNNFQLLKAIRSIVSAQTTPGRHGYTSTFTDGAAEIPMNLVINHRLYGLNIPSDSNYVIAEYVIKNNSARNLHNFYAGLYGDYDVSENGQLDNASLDFSGTTPVGYTYSTEPGGLYTGIGALGSYPVNYYAFTNDGSNNSIDVYDGLTPAEKYQSLSAGLGTRPDAGAINGKDVSQTFAYGPLDINAGDSITVAFTLIAGKNLQEVLSQGGDAHTAYDNIITGKKPLLNNSASLVLYPVPARDVVYIRGNVSKLGAGQLTAYVYDNTGKIVLSQAFVNGAALNVSSLGKGVYQLKLAGTSGIATKRLVVE